MLQTPIIVMLAFFGIGFLVARAWYAEKVAVIESRLSGVKESLDSEVRQLKTQSQSDLTQAKELAEQQRENYQERIAGVKLLLRIEVSKREFKTYEKVVSPDGYDGYLLEGGKDS